MNPIYKRNDPNSNIQSHWHNPCEIFDHVNFIKTLSMWLKPERYLEIGIYQNDCLNVVAPFCKEVYAVDIMLRNPNFPENVKFFQKKSDDFFQELDKSIYFDLAFIDGDHSHEQSLKDFLNIKDRIVEDGFILMHDSYPFDLGWTFPYLCGEVYKTVEYIKKYYYRDFEILTLPIHPGLSLIKKMNHKKQLAYKP